MAVIKPFKGVVYNAKMAKDAVSLMTPPYDIISPRMQDELYRRHPYNVIRLELGKTRKSDTGRDNRYTRARNAFEAWLRKGVMTRDASDALYIYVQQYRDAGKRIERVGFLGLMGFGRGSGDEVLPHENTLKAPKADRLSLMREVRANLSPIFVLFTDKRRVITPFLRRFIARHKPFLDLRWEGERHMVWKMEDPAAIEKVTGPMGKAELFIADGHHRFETAKNYARELVRAGARADLVKRAHALMVYFVEADEKMLTVMPAHRLPKDVGGLAGDAMLARLAPYFTIERSPSLAAMMKRLAALSAGHAFGMYAREGGYRVLRLRDPRVSDRAIKDKPKDWKRLDVSILHLFIFKHILGIRDTDDNIEFVKDPREAAGLVDTKRFPVAFFLNPTKAAQVKRIAKLGERMPRKATYFYPKPLTGLVINKF